MRRAGERADGNLVIVADDFGRKRSINRAVTEAYETGTLTSASIMPGGEAFVEAVRMARTRPGLCLGLHITLCDGLPILSPETIPDLVNSDGVFRKGFVSLSFKSLSKRIRSQIEREVKAQFDRLDEARVKARYVDGHHHLHVHPLIFSIVCREASSRGIGWVRLPLEPLRFVCGAAPRHLPEWAVMRMVAMYDKSVMKSYGMRAPGWVFGLSGTGRIDGKYLQNALKSTGRGVNEIFFHPDKGSVKGRSELNAVASLRFRRHLVSLGLELTNYGRLSDQKSMKVDRGRK